MQFVNALSSTKLICCVVITRNTKEAETVNFSTLYKN